MVDSAGVVACGASAELALAQVQALPPRVRADRLDHGEWPAGALSVSFETSSAGA